MAVIGALGDIVFSVSRDKVKPAFGSRSMTGT